MEDGEGQFNKSREKMAMSAWGGGGLDGGAVCEEKAATQR